MTRHFMLKDIDIYKPLGIGICAALASFSLENIEALSDSLMWVGRLLTALTMILTSVYTLLKLYENAKQDKRKKQGDN